MKGKSWILKILYIFLGLIVLFLVYSHYEYRHIKIRTIEIQSKDIPKNLMGREYYLLQIFNMIQCQDIIENSRKRRSS